MNDTLVIDIRCLSKWCDTCRYELIPHAHGVVKNHDANLMWPVDANILRRTMSQDEARVWLGKVNYRGCEDWRLPTREEYQVIMCDLATCSPYYDFRPYENLQRNGLYWVTGADGTTWEICKMRGEVDDYDPSGSYYVWPVRGLD